MTTSATMDKEASKEPKVPESQAPFYCFENEAKEVIDWIMTIMRQRFESALITLNVLQYVPTSRLQGEMLPLRIMVTEFINERVDYLGPIHEKGSHEFWLIQNPILKPLFRMLAEFRRAIILAMLFTGNEMARHLPNSPANFSEIEAWEKAMRNWPVIFKSSATSI
jgi:hypothetical protein